MCYIHFNNITRFCYLAVSLSYIYVLLDLHCWTIHLPNYIFDSVCLHLAWRYIMRCSIKKSLQGHDFHIWHVDMYKGNRHRQRVIGSSSYGENYIWFNALILIYCIRKYNAPFRWCADCSICGCAENNLIEMNESCFHEICDAVVEQKEDQRKEEDSLTLTGVMSQRGNHV